MAMRKFTFEDVHEWAMKAFPEHYKKLPKVDLQRHRRKCKGYRRKELDLSPYQLSIGKHATEYRIYAFWDNKEEEVLFLEGSERRPHGFLWGPNPGHKLCEPFSLICRSPLINDGSRVGDEMYKSELDSLIKFYFLAKGSPSSIVMDDQTLNSFKWSCRAIVNRDPGQEPPYCQSLLPELCCIADDRKKSNGALVPVFQTTPQTIVQALVICDSLGTPHANDTEKGRKRKASAMAEATSESRVSHTRKETHMSLMKEYLETQEKERQKPNEELDRMTLAKDALDQQLKDLSAQCLKDKGELTNLERRLSVQTGETQRLKADLTKMLAMTKTLNNDNDILRKRVRLRNDAISQIRETLSTTEQRSKSLAKELTEAKQELSQENKNHTSYQESTEKKLISAKDLWRCHKELIELHFRDKDEHVKKAILEALDKEYGIFQYEK